MNDTIQNMLDPVAQYFNGTFETHGAVAEGMDYNSPEAQITRFAQLEKIFDGHQGKFSVWITAVGTERFRITCKSAVMSLIMWGMTYQTSW